MAAIDYKLDLSSWTLSIDQTAQSVYSVSYIVECDDPDDGPLVAATYVGTQESLYVGTTYAVGNEADTYAKCIGISASPRSGDGLQWTVVVSYGALTSSDGSPLNEPPKIRWSYQQRTKLIDRDENGDPILNTALLPYEEAIEIDDPIPVITYEKNYATFNKIWSYSYKNAVNSDAVTIDGDVYGVGLVKVGNIGIEKLHHQTIGFYYNVVYTFLISEDGWQKTLVSAGRYRRAAVGVWMPIYVGGEPVDQPQLLNAAGDGMLAEGGTPIVTSYDVLPSLPFSVFGLA